MDFTTSKPKVIESSLGPRARQVVAALSAGLFLTGMMCTWGFPAAALPQMDEPGSPIRFTKEQSSWFATVTLMMCIPGSLIGAPVYEIFGPRRTMLFTIPLLAISTVAMSLASFSSLQEAGMAENFLLACRIAQSIIVALLQPFITVYTYEVSDQYLRGALSSSVEVWATMGFVLCYITGCFLSWPVIAIVLPLITLCPAFIGMYMSPESPLWLARKDREAEARAALSLVRCTSEEVSNDLKAVLSKNQESKPTCSESLYAAAKLPNAKAIIASCLSLIMKELGGYAVLSIYVVYVLEQTGVGLDPKYSSVIIGLTRVICNAFASFLMHSTPRKLILIVGNTLTGIATFAIGIFFFLQSKGGDVSWLSWLPLTGLVIHMIGAAGSIGPCTWTIAVEVLPDPVRSLGYGMATTSFAVAAFIISKLLLDLEVMIGLQGVFWMFTGGSIGYIILVLAYIPETYGRSLKEIEDYWEGVKVQKEKSKEVFV